MTTEDIYQHFLNSEGICTDTRTLNKGQLYVALKGEQFNGNDYALEALRKGALKAIVDNPSLEHKDVIQVDDALKALQDLAKHHRQQLKIQIIAITGSNGKTTTKKLITEVLQQSFKVKATKGNLNNHIGVPLTLLSFDYSDEFGIVEMGANHQKEIEFLCQIAEPNYGYITNFGKAHLEGFGGIEGVIKGKSELYDFLNSAHRKIFINANDPIQVEKATGSKTYSIGTTNLADCQVELIEAKPFVKLKVNGVQINSQLLGEYNFKNISAAIGVGMYFNVPVQGMKKAIEHFQPEQMRSQLIKRDHYSVILDAYNANPTSVKLALETLSDIEAKHKLAILGDMFEVGEDSLKEHEQILQLASHLNIEHVFTLGHEYGKSKHQENQRHFSTIQSLSSHLKKINLDHYYILIKGSRGMKLEVITNDI